MYAVDAATLKTRHNFKRKETPRVLDRTCDNTEQNHTPHPKYQEAHLSSSYYLWQSSSSNVCCFNIAYCIMTRSSILQVRLVNT